MHRVCLFTLLLCAGCASGPRSWRAAGDHLDSLVVDGRQRSFKLHVPPAWESDCELPLVVMLHGGGGSSWRIDRFTGWSELADREGFAVVYPEGWDGHWNDGREGVETEAHREGIDDVAFLSTLIETLTRELGLDGRRVFVTGASNGGMMTFRLACERPDLLAGAAPVIATMPPALLRTTPSRALPMLVVCGTDDPLVPYEGGDVTFGRTTRGRVASASDSVAFWVRANRCEPTPAVALLPDLDPSDGTRIRVERYDGAAPVVHYAILGGGHTWPGGTSFAEWLLQGLLGAESKDLDTTRSIWRFFSGVAPTG